MKYTVSLVDPNGASSELFYEVDLDYFNIRQWRLLLLHLSKNEYSKVIISHADHTAFDELPTPETYL